MILADTSVWIDHLRRSNAALATLLESGEVLGHPFVIGELACGRMHNRAEILGLLDALPRASVAEHTETLRFVEAHRLAGAGLGWIDVHLLASAALSRAALWTLDRGLRERARNLGIAHDIG